MAYRSAFSLFAGLLLSGVAVACTTTVIQQPAQGGDDAGTDAPVVQQDPPDAYVEPDPPFVFKAAPKGTWASGTSMGGAVVKSGKVVAIVYANDPQKQDIQDFTSKIGASAYWTSVASEYGIGALTPKTPIVLAETAPTSIEDEQIESWLQSRFTTDAAHFGVPDSNTLYAIYYPPGTTVGQGGGVSCKDFGAYHFETNVNGTPISYAVMPRCAAFAGLGGTEVTTFAASHEILEWATDPYPMSDPAYNSVDDDHAVWGRVFLGELADLCTQLGDVTIVPPDLGFTVQRTWSNTSSQAGHHPCAPNIKVPYFTAFPTKTDAISVQSVFGEMITTRGFKVGVGEKKTIDLTVYSDAAMPAWNIQVLDITRIQGGDEEFTYSLSRAKVKSGDPLTLTITGVAPAQQGQGFLIISQSKGETNMYPVWVTN